MKLKKKLIKKNKKWLKSIWERYSEVWQKRDIY